MATISYKVVADGAQWSVTRNGVSYGAQEAAFEVAVGEAGGDLRTGRDIVIQVTAATARRAPLREAASRIPGDGFSG